MSVESPPNGQQSTILVQRGVDAITASAKDTRRKFLWTWLALATVSLLTGLALFLSIRLSSEQNDLAQRQAEQANATADQTVAYLRGEQGIPGVPGSNGQEGTPGLPGGKGETGPQGPAGPKGATGAAGAIGPTGAAGAAGAAGADGSPGVAGPAGATGERGAQGPHGEKGATGPAGAKGATGATGAKGAVGPAGAVGATGPAGPPGPAGPSGGVTTCPQGTTPLMIQVPTLNPVSTTTIIACTVLVINPTG